MSDADIMAAAIEKVVDDKVARAMRDGAQTVTAEYMGADSEGKAWVMLPGASSATPVRRSSVEASVGDTVSVTVGNGMATLDANLTDKSAGVAGVAKVDAKATVAQETAAEAIDYATQASAAASSAQSSANNAMQSAGIAQASADSAVADAARANEAAVQAISDAADAADAASSAQTSANSARTSADKANYALADMEKVVGTVNWIAEHGEYALTSDTAVDDSKVYYTRSGSGTDADPYVYTRVANPVDSAISTYYELVDMDESIQNFINAHVWLETDGLYVGTQGTDYKARIDADSLDILDDTGAVVATFGETAQIGKAGESHIELDYHSLRMVDKDGAEYLNVNDMREADNKATITEAFEGTGTTYHLEYIATEILSCNVNGSPASYTTGTTSAAPRHTYVTLSTAMSDGDRLVVVYKTENGAAKSYTIGTRAANSTVGPMSHAHGTEVESSGYASHAEGEKTHASGKASHAEGSTTYAGGNYSHAEGWMTHADGAYSHAEGNHTTASKYSAHAEGDQTVAGGGYSHAEGWNSKAQGMYSHAQNMDTIAKGEAQTAIGRYNVEDDDDLYALIIGNGEWDEEEWEYTRSNALTVDWNGNVECNEVNGLALRSMGEIREASDTASVASGDNADVASIRLPPGTWLVNARLQYPSNSTGRRAAKLSTTSEDGGNVISTDVRNAVSGGTTQVQTERVFAISSADVGQDGKAPVYLVAWQNSGSTLSCAGNMQAVRLSPAIGESYDGGGGGGGGTSDYTDLTNKPSIEGVTLVDDKTFPDLGLFIDAGEQYPQSDDYALTTTEINVLWNNVMA